jgi:hypothetical protein
MWAKIWVFEEMAKLRSWDVTTGKFLKRTKGTVSMFPELNREALAILLEDLVKKAKGSSLDGVDPNLSGLIDQGRFSEIYAYVIQKVSSRKVDLNVTLGEWKIFKQGSDSLALTKSLACTNTGWCTAGEDTAATTRPFLSSGIALKPPSTM